MKSRLFALSLTLPCRTLVAALATVSMANSASAGAVPGPAFLAAPSPSTAAFNLEKSEAAIADDIAFAKGLAKDWGFVDLASQIIKRIEKDGVNATTAERLGVVKCEIYAQGALSERDRTRRNELFEQTLAAYDDFLKNNPNSSAAAEARSGFISMSSAFAHSLQISMEDAIGEQAETLRARREEVLLAANDRTGDLISDLEGQYEEEPSETLKRELIKMMIMRASLNLEIGKSSDDGAFSFEEARKILENVVFEAGDGSPDALRAYNMIGQVFSAEQNWQEAAIYFRAVVEAALPEDVKSWNTLVDEMELTQSDKEQRWLFLELSIGGLIEAYLSSGEIQDASRYAMHLYNTQRREGFEFSTRMGYPSLLVAARVLLETGGVIGGKIQEGQGKWYETAEAAAEAGYRSKRNRISTTDLALKIAQQVAKENPRNVLRLKAQKLIGDITSRPGVSADPEVLYEVAEGLYNSRENDPGALAAFKVVLNAIEDKDNSTKILLGPKTFFRMGRTYNRLNLTFEAAMAFREGCTTYVGDPEYDSVNAEAFYKAMQALLSSSNGDPVVQALYQEAENINAKLSVRNKDEILMATGDRARRKKDYAGAIEKYSQVQRSATDYEKALVYVQVCKWGQGERDSVLTALEDYLDNYVTNDLNGVQGSKIGKRKDAVGMARYFRAAIEYEKKMYGELIASSASYHLDHPDQSSFAPRVMNMVGNAYVKLGRIAEARALLSDLQDLFPGNTWGSKLGVSIYNDLKKQRAALAPDAEEHQALALEMATLMEASNKIASKPSFANMRAESKHWQELKNWDKAVPLLEKILTKFGALDKYRDSLTKYIKPDLAGALLAQLRVVEANAILSDLVLNEGAKPSRSTLLNYIRSTTGWVQGTASNIEEVPGAGTTAEAFKAASDKLNSLANSGDKWACEWYNLKFQLAYAYYRWGTAEGGPQDSKKLDSARKQLNVLVQDLGTDFKGGDGVEGVDTSCAGFPEFDNDVLRRRLVWLWGKVK